MVPAPHAGTANVNAGPVMAFTSGNLCCQIEQHLFPDLPSNRYAVISRRVKICRTTGPFIRQYLLSLRTILELAPPDRFLAATSDDAPETSSELEFTPPDTTEPWSHQRPRRRTGRRTAPVTVLTIDL